MKPEQIVTIEATLVACTPRAILIEQEGNETWLPLSQIIWSDEESFQDFFDDGELRRGARVKISMTEWIAKQKGFA